MKGVAGRVAERGRRLLGAIDARAGHRLELLVMAHHKRRLRRAGHAGVLTSPADDWAAGGWPVRGGNLLEVLIDGAEALPEISAAIEAARSSVWLAGWFFSPDLCLRRDPMQTLVALLGEAGARVDVRVLAWAGAPFPVFHPDRTDVRRVRKKLSDKSGVRVALDRREHPLHCHHEKLVIVDGRVAFVGGIDLTTYGGDRFDCRTHPPRQSIGWHDVTTRLRGPVVADVVDHFRLRWREVTDEELPPPPPQEVAGPAELQVVRTVPERIYDRLPQGEFTIVASYLGALRSARHFIYLENQFLWSPEIVSVLSDKLCDPPDERFRVLILLPAKPNNGNDNTRGQLGLLVDADNGAGRVLACTLYQRGHDGQPVYVHAKVAIVDDAWMTIGSANLNEYSLFNDTEMNVVTRDATLARATRLRLWSEHLDRPVAALERDPTELIDTMWRPIAETQLQLRQRGQPLTHKLARLPHVSRRSEALRGRLDAFVVDA